MTKLRGKNMELAKLSGESFYSCKKSMYKLCNIWEVIIPYDSKDVGFRLLRRRVDAVQTNKY